MYAILDIETTGGKYNEEGITEIAIHKYDGHQVVDTFISSSLSEKNGEILLPVGMKFLVDDLKVDINRVSLSGAILGEGEKSQESKKRINDLVREIDNCIALLNNI